jgi:DNA polymerase-3 subunit alpha
VYNKSMPHPFIHLHVHSHYSLLNALPKIDDLVARAKELNMPALAITDAGNMYGVIDFYQACVKKGIKPIIGVDFYVATRTRKDMQAGVDSKRHRLVLLAKDFEGYKNLIKLVTHSNLEGFYYKPRIDAELIEKHNQGLIAIAPSFSSEISVALKMRDLEKAKEKIAWYKKIYPDFYIEITRHPTKETDHEYRHHNRPRRYNRRPDGAGRRQRRSRQPQPAAARDVLHARLRKPRPQPTHQAV